MWVGSVARETGEKEKDVDAVEAGLERIYSDLSSTVKLDPANQ